MLRECFSTFIAKSVVNSPEIVRKRTSFSGLPNLTEQHRSSGRMCTRTVGLRQSIGRRCGDPSLPLVVPADKVKLVANLPSHSPSVGVVGRPPSDRKELRWPTTKLPRILRPRYGILRPRHWNPSWIHSGQSITAVARRRSNATHSVRRAGDGIGHVHLVLAGCGLLRRFGSSTSQSLCDCGGDVDRIHVRDDSIYPTGVRKIAKR